ncbi:OLC1v1016193C1 [Oldenlandia corymbosa var. corymbosa]|uniref:OLC1v1016193C1 n=1 Tax=Oldenlandia corymbosa var. corymbosa TaxID=529605 RepID=A0AAV1E7C5_OLDCO|nr:OLC1v1016193C1 [Oldenlandia corymbosa var. corymbosa]
MDATVTATAAETAVNWSENTEDYELFSSAIDPETAFLASKKETGNEWELFKENVRPLKRGRKVAVLNNALKSHITTASHRSLLENRRRLIQAIDEYQGDDPLQPWLQCIKWVQEAFPPGGDSSGLVVIYEQCVRSFWHEPRYKDDLRYLKVWLEYAENCMDAEVVYSFLEANKIGLTHASFYIAYALHMESKNKMRTANEIFNRGISMNAQPIEKLNAAYRKFFNRSMTRPKVVEEEPTENRAPLRSFGTLLPNGEPRDGFGLAKKKLKTDRAGGASLAIYKDTETDVRLGHQSQTSKLTSKSWQNLGAREERNKENSAVPSRWTVHKIPQKFGHRNGGTVPSPSIEIFVDEECNGAQKLDKETVKSSAGLRLRDSDDKELKKETELLRENPLRHFPPSSLPR